MNSDIHPPSQSSRWLSFPLGMTFILLLGLALPVLGSAVSAAAFPEWQWLDRSFHTLLETLGGLLALTLGTLLFRHPHAQRQQLYYWMSCGLVGMGTLDVFHALVEVGEIFVWFHSSATFVGGMLFMVGRWQKHSLPFHVNRSLPFAIGFASILFGIGSWQFSDLLPIMIAGGEFTIFAKALNILGGLGFFVAATRFIQLFRHHGAQDEWLFAIHCTLFGTAAMLFEMSTLWDASWWWWHCLRLMAYGTGLQCIFTFAQLQSSEEFSQHLLGREKGGSSTLSPTNHRYGTWLPLVIVLVCVSSLAAGGMTLSIIHDHLIQKEGKTLAIMASNVTQHFEQNIFERKGDIELLTKAPVFKQANTQAMSAHLQAVAQTYQAYLALSYVNAESTIIASTSLDLLGKNLKDEPIAVAMQQAPAFHFDDVRSLPYFNQTLSLTFAAPVLTPRGNYQGMILGHVGLPYLKRIFDRATQRFTHQIDRDSYFEWLLLNHEGIVIVDSLLQEEGLVNLRDLQLPSAQLLENGPANYVKEFHFRKNIPVVTGYARTQDISGISNLHWGILIRKAQADVLASVMEVESKVSLVGGSILFSMIGLLMLSVFRLQTSQARATQALEFAKASAVQNHLLLNSAGEGIWGLDLDGNTTFVNQSATTMLGFTFEELIGVPMHSSVHHTRVDGSPYPREDCPMYAAFRDGTVHEVNDEILWRKDGTSFPVEYTSTPIRNRQGELEGAVVIFKDITERKQKEEQLQRLTERLQLATTSAHIGVWDFDVLNNVFNWDEQMYALHGTTVADFECANQAWAHGLHPEDRTRTEQEMQRALQEDQTFNTEFRVVWPDGSIHCIEAHALVERNSFGSALRMVGVNRDITERKREQEKIHLIVESAPIGLMMINQDGKIIIANQVLEQEFGYERGELLDKSIEWLVPERIQAQHPVLPATFFANPQPQLTSKNRDLVGLRKDGTEFPVEIKVNPITIEDGFFVLVSANDITTRKQEEARLHQYMDELRRSNQDLDDFAYIASHDLKEPLRGIFNFSSILLEDYGSKLNEDAHSKCQTLLRLSKHMEELINSLFRFSRAGRTELSTEPIDLQQMLDHILESLEVRLKECRVIIRIPRPLPTIPCDRVQVGEIFRNLITNAMKYNDKDEKWIEIGFLTVGEVPREALDVTRDVQDGSGEQSSDSSPEVDLDEEQLVLYVRDNGIGIRDKHLPNIFRIFKRLHGRDKFGGGTGAGLTITKKLVERHGGTLWVESTYGEGTTFYLTLQGRIHDVTHTQTANSIG